MQQFDKTLYWHDYETWGERPAFDRPAQFAGVRTDEALNIIEAPLMLYAKPALDVLPKPDAVLITGITPQEALAKGVSEADFMAQIVAQLGRPNTCGVGYNSIRFDDEVTRYGLYRNFYDPYEREWKNGNSRWDLVDVVRMMRALRPRGLEWPFYEDGTPCNKLEALASANGLVHEQAHDALSDVYATIALARAIKTAQPRFYDYAYGLRDKRRVAQLLNCGSFTPLLHSSSRFPSRWLNTSLIMPLLAHPTNRNSVICFNLRQHPRDLLQLSVEQLRERLYVAQADLPEGVERIALKEVHLNRAPMIATAALLDSEVAARIDMDLAACEAHLAIFHALTAAEREALSAKLHRLYAADEPPLPMDVDGALYGGFIGDADRRLMYELRRQSPQARAVSTTVFEDERLNQLLWRYQGRNFSQHWGGEAQAQWRAFCRERWQLGVAGWGLSEFWARMDALRQEATDPRALELLGQLADYVREHSM